MALLRLIHAAEMPDPASLMRKLSGDTPSVAAPASPAQPDAAAPTSALPGDFVALVEIVERSGKHLLAQQLHDQVGLALFAPPELALKPMRPLGPDFVRDLSLALKSATGATWHVSLSDGSSEPSLLDQEKMAQERERDAVLADPQVKAIMEAFPGSTLESYASTGGA